MAFDDLFISELRNRNDIESVVSSYVNLKRKGRLLGGLCPFHNENTPSFYVYPDTQSYYCFGCGNGGDVITFIKNIENLDYYQAVKFLCDRSGMALPSENYDNGISKTRTRIYEANREAARFYYKKLFEPCGEKAREYCEIRQLTRETVTKFGIGFAPDGWTSLKTHLNKMGFTDLELHMADLVKKGSSGSYYDTFRNRLVFPIIDLRGNVIAFSGRKLNEEDRAKYVNTGDTPVYKKGREIFALNFVKKNNFDNIILCEGNIDVVMLHQAGFTNAVAALGTALTQEQVQVLSRYTGEILLCYDSDEAGQRAVKKALDIFSHTTLRVKVINMKGGKDPDEIIKKYGASRFKMMIDGAANDIEYKLMLERDKFDVSTSDGKVNFIKAASRVLAEVSSPIETDIYASKIAEEFSVNKEALISEIKKNSRISKRQKSKENFSNIQKSLNDPKDLINKINPDRQNNLHIAKAEETVIACLISNPSYYKSIKDKLCPEDFVTEFNRRVFGVLCERLENGKPIEISYIAHDFSDDEISVITRIAASSHLISNTLSECEDCIKIIKSERGKGKYNNASGLSDADFLNLFNKN